MKKICIAFNHLNAANGVARAAIGMANFLCNKMEVTLRPIFGFDKKILSLLDNRIIIKPLFGFYFRGFSKIVSLIPLRLIHDIVFGKDKYDTEVGFQYGIATKAVVSHGKSNAKHIVWMHGYDEGLKLKKYYVKSDCVVCVSEANACRFKKEINNVVPSFCCYNLIDDNKIKELGKENIDITRNASPLLISVGRLSKEKGYKRLLEITKTRKI